MSSFEPNYLELINLFHIHIPFVHGSIVGPTLKPEFPIFFLKFNKTEFIKNDFPVLYLPTIDITPIF